MHRKFREGNGVWADTGTKAAVPADITTTKIAEGWVSGSNADRPSIEYLNFLQNRVEEAIDRLIEDGPGSVYPRSADLHKGLTTGQWDDCWAITSDAANKYDTGTADAITDIAVYFNSDDEPRLLVSENTGSGGKIRVVDPRGMSSIIFTNLLGDDLGAGAWNIESICTDGTYVFALCYDAANNWKVNCWAIDETTADWAVLAAWAATSATGIALTGTGTNPVTTNKSGKIIIADDDYVAISCTWVTVATSASAAIQMLARADGTAATPGAGDCTGGSTYYPDEPICSDGTNIFFTATDTAAAPDVTLLCSATIADLTAGSGGAGYPYTLPVGAATGCRGRGLCQIGVGGPFISVHDGDPHPGAAFTNIIVNNATTAGLCKIEIGDLGSAEEGEDYIATEILDITFDGLNAWILCWNNDGSNRHLNAIKIDIAKLLIDAQTDEPWVLDVTNSIFRFLPTKDFPVYNNVARGDVVCRFDGRDLWVNPEPRVSQTHSGELYRLPMALIRH